MIADSSNIMVNYTCDECGSSFKVKLGQLASEQKVRCPEGHSIQLVDHDQKAMTALRELGGKASKIFR
jgi:predicted Zn finger-like uncharacterized protein